MFLAAHVGYISLFIQFKIDLIAARIYREYFITFSLYEFQSHSIRFRILAKKIPIIMLIYFWFVSFSSMIFLRLPSRLCTHMTILEATENRLLLSLLLFPP